MASTDVEAAVNRNAQFDYIQMIAFFFLVQVRFHNGTLWVRGIYKPGVVKNGVLASRLSEVCSIFAFPPVICTCD